jgi:hypothetical protein
MLVPVYPPLSPSRLEQEVEASRVSFRKESLQSGGSVSQSANLLMRFYFLLFA